MLKPEKDKAKKQKRGKERDRGGEAPVVFLPGEVATDNTLHTFAMTDSLVYLTRISHLNLAPIVKI